MAYYYCESSPGNALEAHGWSKVEAEGGYRGCTQGGPVVCASWGAGGGVTAASQKAMAKCNQFATAQRLFGLEQKEKLAVARGAAPKPLMAPRVSRAGLPVPMWAVVAGAGALLYYMAVK